MPADPAPPTVGERYDPAVAQRAVEIVHDGGIAKVTTEKVAAGVYLADAYLAAHARIERLEGELERIALYAPETKNGGALDRLMAIREIAQAALCGGAAGTQVTHTGDGHGDHG